MTPPEDDELLLARLRSWLQDARHRGATLNGEAVAEPAAAPSPEADFSLYRLLEEFTALRHEVKLQTKSTRGQDEQNAALRTSLQQAIEALRSVEPKEAQAAHAAGKGLAAALADLDEALERGRAQIEQAGRRMIERPTDRLLAEVDALFASQAAWRRRLARPYYDGVRDILKQDGTAERQALLAALLEGYGLIQSRLARSLAAAGLERMKTLRQSLDPERMIAVEAVEAADLPPGLVVEEIRAGYLWNSRVLRYAEVRVSRLPIADSSSHSLRNEKDGL